MDVDEILFLENFEQLITLNSLSEARKKLESLSEEEKRGSMVRINFIAPLPGREKVMMRLSGDGAADDERLVDLLLALLKQVKGWSPSEYAEIVEAALYKISGQQGTPPLLAMALSCDVERAAEAAREMCISPDMARRMDTAILPHIDLHHRLALAEILRLLALAQVQHLKIWGHKAGGDLGGFLGGQQQLVTLAFTHSRIGKECVRGLCTLLSSASNSLQALALWKINMDAEDAEALFSAMLSPACRLESLRLKHTDIGRRGMERLSQALLHQGCPISRLTLDGAEFGPIAAALKNEHCHLCILELYFTPESMWGALWEAVGHPACKLECLLLHQAEVPEQHINKAVLALLLSKIKFLGITNPSKILLELIRIKIRHLKVTVSSEEATAALAELAGRPDCYLQSLLLRITEGKFEESRRQAATVLAAIDRNYQSRLTTLKVDVEVSPITRRSFEPERCEHIVKRNKLLLSLATQEQEAFAEVSCSKLFICGKSGAGKTTVATNLKRRLPWYPACLQRHSTTQGIHMPGTITYHNNNNRKNRLVICDIAGQEEYHAFHHYFMRGSDKNIFLVVCKAFLNGDNSGIEMDLRYWLRFITSHRSVSPDRKPKVFIALNYHDATTTHQEGNSVCVQQVLSIARDYSPQLLDIEEPIFEVVALNVRNLKPLKRALGHTLEQVLEQHSKVPVTCKLIQNFKHAQQKRNWKGASMVMILEELAAEIFPRSSSNDLRATTDAIKFSLACMHDMGESLYFGIDFETDKTMSESAVLDMQWFVQELISIFIKVQRPGDKYDSSQANEERYTIPMINAASNIKKRCSVNHLEFILRSLHNMGVLLPWDTNWDQATWSESSPATIIVPAILKKEFQGVPDDPDHRVFWGRRIICEDTKCTLLPSGVFTMLQVKLRGMCKSISAIDIGQGWISFTENTVYAAVRVGGSSEHWADRQWVDVLVTAPNNEKKCIQAERTLVQIKDDIYHICKSQLPGLRLMECVLNPTYAKRKVAGQTKQFEKTMEWMAVPLEKIYEEAVENEDGLAYSHTWDTKSMNVIGELLMPGEVQVHAQNLISPISSDYKEWVAERYELPPLEPWKDFAIRHAAGNDLLLATLQRLDNRLERLEQRLINIEAGIHDLKSIAQQTQTLINNYGKQVLMACAKMLDKLDISCPRFPYVTNEQNFISQNLLLLPIAETIRLHYCCEASTGIHLVAGSIGLQLAVARPWFRDHSYVLVPAITAICFAIKTAGAAVGSIAGPAGNIVSALGDAFKAGVDTALQSVLTLELRHQWQQCPSEKDLNELFEMVEKVKGEQNLHYFMDKIFGLNQQGGKWLCKDHKL